MSSSTATSFLILLLISSLLSFTSAQQVLFQSYPSTVVIGRTYQVAYGTNGLIGSSSDPNVLINLMKGPTNNLTKIAQIDNWHTSGGIETYSWNLTATNYTLTPATDYALEIVFSDGTSPNYSNQISVLAAGSTITAQATVTSVINRPSVTPTTTSTSNSTATGSLSSASSSDSSSGGSSGLSGGAIAGIVIGVLAVVALVVVGGLLLLRHRRKNRSQGTVKIAQMVHAEEKKRPIEVDAGTEATRMELGGNEVVPQRIEKDGHEIRS